MHIILSGGVGSVNSRQCKCYVMLPAVKTLIMLVLSSSGSHQLYSKGYYHNTDYFCLLFNILLLL